MDGTGRAAEAGVASVVPAEVYAQSAISGSRLLPYVKGHTATTLSASALCPPPNEEEVQRLISTVGKLPTSAPPIAKQKQAVKQAGRQKRSRSRQYFQLEDSGSEAGSQAESVGGVSEMCEKMEDFVKEMVRGKKVNIIEPNGEIISCTVSLTRALDVLEIKAGVHARWVINLSNIAEIAAGADVQHSMGVVDTPLDELCATLMLASCSITFQMVDLNARDTFIMFFLMFCDNQKQ